MTTLNNLLGTLTGPRRLRSVLRQKTVAISSLLVALERTAELRATIPAAVFGGDIFGVMSTQLRDALIVPPPPASVVSRPHRKQSIALLENSFAKHSKDLFSENVLSPLAARLKRLTLPGDTSLNPTTPFRNTEGLSSESLAEVSENSPRQQTLASKRAHALSQPIEHALQRSSVTGLSAITAATSSTPTFAPASNALVNNLNRYWQHALETNRASRANESIAANDQSGVSHHTTVSDLEQPGSTVWSNPMITDDFKSRASVNERRSPLNETTNSVAGRALRSERPKSGPEPDFNFHPANNHAPHYDDLGDRLAQILHEQALQHGIDVT